ncbi:MAG: BMC domain-containing protein [Eubacteriales bacterium]|nr:BMC domain-containing protein [Eubacteriales bacterium]
MTYGAFGLVEVLGSSNAVMVIDQMLKTSEVVFRTWNSKCGGHTTVFLSGDVAAVSAAVDSVRENPPCEVIAAAVISNPSGETVRLVEEDAAKHGFQ